MKTTAIICAFNEETTIKDVILFVSEVKSVNEIIVVNDGSKDATEKIIKEIKQKVELKDIHYEENKGKGHAMAVGVENTSNEIIVFIDADQTNIVSDYIDQITSPLLKNEYDMVLGYSTVNIINKDINPLKILTGERAVFKKDLIPILGKMKESKFGVETLLYFHFFSVGKTIKFIRLIGLRHKDKFQKESFAKATISYINEGWEITYTAIKNYDLMLKTVKTRIFKKEKHV